MKVDEAKNQVIALIERDIAALRLNTAVDARSPDRNDPGKFMLANLPARVIHRFSGWHVPISLAWFTDYDSFPKINRGEFYWYVFAIPRYGGFRMPHYFICDFHQLRQWVLEFSAPKGRDHRDHTDWLAGIHPFPDDPDEHQAYFRWGDEPLGRVFLHTRVVRLDNAYELVQRDRFVGVTSPDGESEAHRRLKLYVAKRPALVGLSNAAEAHVEYGFRTGDRVDILFENHGPRRAAVEVELVGSDSICTGIHQAIKYRSLAAADCRHDLSSPQVRGILVAFETAYPEARDLASFYGIDLYTVPRERVLTV